jgi:opacity protein-like surface antigen
MNKKLTTLALAGAVSMGALATASQPAHALGADINGSRISWYSTLPCSDGSGGLNVAARFKYTTASAGTYQMRLGVYSTDGARLMLGPIRQLAAGGSGYELPYPTYYNSSGYTGQAESVAFVHKWNGSSWALVARETIPCM